MVYVILQEYIYHSMCDIYFTLLELYKILGLREEASFFHYIFSFIEAHKSACRVEGSIFMRSIIYTNKCIDVDITTNLWQFKKVVRAITTKYGPPN